MDTPTPGTPPAVPPAMIPHVRPWDKWPGFPKVKIIKPVPPCGETS